MAGLSDIQPTFDERVPVIMTGCPFRITLPDLQGAADYGDRIRVGGIYSGPRNFPAYKVVFFDVAASPTSGLIEVPLDDIMPNLPNLETPVPDIASTGIKALDTVRSLRVTLEFIVPDPDVDDRMIMAQREAHVLKAGISGRDWYRYGQDYLSTRQNNFLTNQPLLKPILPNQADFLYYLHCYGQSDSLTMMVRGKTTTGAAVSVDRYLFEAETYQVYEIPVGPQRLEIPEDTAWYELCLVNSDGKRVSEVRTYKIDRRPHRTDSVVLIENSFGCFDSLALFGDWNHRATFSADVSAIYAESNRDRSTQTNFRQETRTHALQTGAYPPEWQLYFSEVYRTPRASIVRDDDLLHVNVTSLDSELASSQRPEFSREILFTEPTSSFFGRW